jgi:hypothetical protein
VALNRVLQSVRYTLYAFVLHSHCSRGVSKHYKTQLTVPKILTAQR